MLIMSESLIRKENIMSKIKAFVKRHPVLTYYAMVFAISWGCIIIVLGPGGFLGTTQTSRTQLFVGGPLSLLGPSIAGVFLTGLIYGKAGLRELLSRLFRWRVGARWYTVALLAAPLVMTATLLALSLISPVFLPAIITADNKASLLVYGIVLGFVSSPFFEELGWTGFAIPEIRKRYDILTTGLIMGLLWGAWHFPIFSASAGSSGTVPPVLYLAVLLFSWLPPYRVLMVWVYDHTKSLLVLVLMHVPIVVDQFVLKPAGISGVALLTHLLVFGAALWVVVAVIAVVNGRQLSQQSLQRRMA